MAPNRPRKARILLNSVNVLILEAIEPQFSVLFAGIPSIGLMRNRSARQAATPVTIPNECLQNVLEHIYEGALGNIEMTLYVDRCWFDDGWGWADKKFVT